MTTLQAVAVTYVGKENPFKDRIYRSGLTFTPNQTRPLPPELAARFLRHEDVFKEGKPENAPAAPAVDSLTGEAIQSVDDTANLLEQTQRNQDAHRDQDSARFALLDQIDAMDKTGVISWAHDHYKQKIPGNLGVAKAREMAKGFIDQYGMP